MQDNQPIEQANGTAAKRPSEELFEKIVPLFKGYSSDEVFHALANAAASNILIFADDLPGAQMASKLSFDAIWNAIHLNWQNREGMRAEVMGLPKTEQKAEQPK